MIFKFFYFRKKKYLFDNTSLLTYLLEFCFVAKMVRAIFPGHDLVVHPGKNKTYNLS